MNSITVSCLLVLRTLVLSFCDSFVYWSAVSVSMFMFVLALLPAESSCVSNAMKYFLCGNLISELSL